MSYPKSPKKLALITGGANGIGLATAQQLAKQNYDLFLIDKDEENLKIAQSKVLSLGAEVQILALHCVITKDVKMFPTATMSSIRH